jgi:predicted metal-dependent RNase
MTDDRVSSERMERMAIEITNGKIPEAKNAAEREARATLMDDIEEIRKKGGEVEIPYELP